MKQQLNFTAISKIDTKDAPIKGIEDMKFGVVKETNTPVFNYTEYLINSGFIESDCTSNDVYKTTLRMIEDCSFNIDNMLKMYNIESNRVLFTDSKTVYINSILSMIVASYHNPSMISEAFDYLKDIYTFGFALSDNVLYQQCAYNMPDEMLISILQSRQNNNK